MNSFPEVSANRKERNPAYAELTQRNLGFVVPELQERIRCSRLLIAGCGLGSVIAEAAVRTGFSHLVLVDGDRIEPHNLNRQMYRAQDIGRLKVDALADRLREIHPDAQVQAIPEMLSATNVRALVSACDLVVDSVDFLDAGAILELHAEARRQGKTVLAPLAVGWGAAAMVFAPHGASLRELVGVEEGRSVEGLAYTDLFVTMLERYATDLPAYAVKVVHQQMAQIRDRKPCPISQLCGGTFSAGALTVRLAVQILAGESVRQAPEMIVWDAAGALQTSVPAAA